jgi:hypothetical protein
MTRGPRGQPSLPPLRKKRTGAQTVQVLPVLAENPIHQKMGLDWTCTMLLSRILTVHQGINS